MKYAFIAVVFAILLTPRLQGQSYSFDFSTGYEGWTGDFADYPVTDSVFFELEFLRTTLPPPLNTGRYGLKISGFNRSDDLFMFIKRKISGLVPNTTYRLQIDVSVASQAPTNAFGIGGPPGEAVRMKAGATLLEPKKVNSSGFYLMNIDKSNQIQPGADMDTIGHVGVTDTTTVFAIIQRGNATHPFRITTDGKGEVWVCIGTDSGFEGLTTLYYTNISLTFSSLTAVEPLLPPRPTRLFPNPVTGVLYLDNSLKSIRRVELTDLLGRRIRVVNETTSLPLGDLPPGSYLVGITFGDGSTEIRKVLVE